MRAVREGAALAGLVWLCAAPQAALAVEGISVQFKGGISNFSLAAGQSYKQDGGSGLEMRSQINYEAIPINTSFGVFYQGHLGSNIGSFPINRVGAAIYYYPFGHPMATMPLDDGVTISQTRIAPFLSAQVAFSTLAITDNTGAHPLPFNGSATAYIVSGGLEMPLGQTTSILGEILYEGTLAGGTTDSSGALSSTGLSYTTVGGMLGISIHP
jgi:hypothetical protein